MKKTLLTIAILLGATAAVNAQSLPSTNRLIDNMGNQYELGSPEAYVGEELFMDSQGKVIDANGNEVGYRTKTGPGMDNVLMHEENIDDIIINLGGASELKKMAGQ